MDRRPQQRTWVRQGALILVLGALLGTAAPRPAQAQTLLPDVTALMGTLDGLFAGVFGVILAHLEWERGQLAAIAALVNGEASKERKIGAKAAQYDVDEAHRREATSEYVRVVMEHTRGPKGVDPDCNAMTLASRPPSFSDPYGGRAMLAGVLGMNRGEAIDGRGPIATMRELAYRCQTLKSMHPKQQPPAECKSSDPDMWDVDLSFRLLSGQYVLEWPKIKKTEIPLQNGAKLTVYQPELGSNPKKEVMYFLSAVNYCYHIAGIRPTPPEGAQLTRKPHEKVSHNTCSAELSAHLASCFERVLRLSRADCKASGLSAEMKKNCEESAKQCKAAKALGVDLQGYDCELGLSPYQIDDLRHKFCFAANFAVQMAANGVQQPEILEMSDMCHTNWQIWVEQNQRETGAITDAAKGIQEAKDCWDGLGQSGPKVAPQP